MIGHMNITMKCLDALLAVKSELAMGFNREKDKEDISSDESLDETEWKVKIAIFLQASFFMTLIKAK